MSVDDPGFLAREYATMDRFARRRLDLTGFISDAGEPIDTLLVALAEVRPTRVLDAGCGNGQWTRLVTAPEVVAVDSSPAAVEATRALGIDARLADVRELPFADGEFDAVMCNWMLYHVPDRARAIRELARVLRPGGRLVGCYNRRGHLEELWSRFGDPWAGQPDFGCEDGAEELRPHFERVEIRSAGGAVLWDSREALQAYLDAYVEFLGPLEAPAEPYPFRAGRRNCVLVAETRA